MKVVAYMTVRDEEFYIEMALLSVVKRSYGVYILDTGSVDKTVEIVKELQKKYPNIVIEEKSFGGKYRWDGYFENGKPMGYRQADAANYTRERMKFFFTDFDWTIIMDADEIVTDKMFDEIERVDKLGAERLGHATRLPLFPSPAMMIDEEPKDYRPIMDDFIGKDWMLFDPHYRAWSNKVDVVWGYSKFNHIQSNFTPGKKIVSPEDLHFHFHYSFGPKSVPGWICKWSTGPQGFAHSVGIPVAECNVQKHYEEKFPDWFSNGRFKPKKEFLDEARKRCIPMQDPLPDYVVKKWNEWGDWS